MPNGNVAIFVDVFHVFEEHRGTKRCAKLFYGFFTASIVTLRRWSKVKIANVGSKALHDKSNVAIESSYKTLEVT